MSALKGVKGFNEKELELLEKLGFRLRKGKVKVERSKEELELIERAKNSGVLVGRGGGDGSKERVNKGVGDFVRGLIFKDEKLSNKEVLELISKEYGNKNTTLSCVSWYRNDIKKNWVKGDKEYKRVK
jgi:hypothetical protein